MWSKIMRGAVGHKVRSANSWECVNKVVLLKYLYSKIDGVEYLFQFGGD